MSQASSRELPMQTVASTDRHGHAHVVARPAAAKMSLLRLSAVQRLGGVAALLAGLWALVFWALH